MLCQFLQYHVIIGIINLKSSYFHTYTVIWEYFSYKILWFSCFLRSRLTKPGLGVTYTDIESPISVHDCLNMYFTN